MTNFIFITGGVMSSLGKGIASASISALLKSCGFRISVLKIDPYINVDPGTMSPLEHGEVFVTEDGAETDLDIGHYERFLDVNLSRKNNFTTGQIYLSVIENEREGRYLGQTIQVVPHIVNEIKARIKSLADPKNPLDFLIVEIGGTVGDIESMPFLEALRQMRHENPTRVMNIHLTPILRLKTTGEEKTKPTQHSVQELRRIGISPNILLLRTETPLPNDLKKKLAVSCDVPESAVISAVDAKNIYECPLLLHKEGILSEIFGHFGLQKAVPNLSKWENLVAKILDPKHAIKIAFVGKYVDLKESYKSLTEALIHAGAHANCAVEILWLDSEKLEHDISDLKNVNGVLIPGGFGTRGIAGKIAAIKYAREENLPFFGICLGMQLAIIEFLRNVVRINANSTEFDAQTTEPAVYLIEDFLDATNSLQIRTEKSPLGGTMRLGAYDCILADGSKIAKSYGATQITERHRHRYEANPAYANALQKSGMKITGWAKNSGSSATNLLQNSLIEAIEIPQHKFFMAVQFHPEFTSRLERPNPLILDFVKKCME